MKKIINFFKNKYTIITIITISIISLIITLALVYTKKEEKDRFTLNEIYNVFPEEVRELYSNTVEVSCYGDLHFDISVDDGEVSVDKLNKNHIIDYVFSHIDKKYNLNEKITNLQIEKTINNLIDSEKDFIKHINNYKYGNNTYSINNGKLVITESICSSDVKYISKLYGYTYGTEILSMDVNIGYLKNDILYDMQGKKLGEYKKTDYKKLDNLFIGIPYYRYNYIKDGDNYKLTSVQLNIRYTPNEE